MVITVKKDNAVKIALDFRKINDSFIKMRPYMSNMKELPNQITTESKRVQNEPLWKSKIDFEYAYGQMKLSNETSKHYNFAKTGGNLDGYYRFKKYFYGLSNIPTLTYSKKNKTVH